MSRGQPIVRAVPGRVIFVPTPSQLERWVFRNPGDQTATQESFARRPTHPHVTPMPRLVLTWPGNDKSLLNAADHG